MEINLIESKKNKLIFELKGSDHTICNALKDELWNDDHIKVATYSVRHPLISVPKFVVETDGAEPKKMLVSAAQRLQKMNNKVKDDFAKEVR